MAIIDQSKINKAIRACLQCCSDKAPDQIMPAMREFLKGSAVGSDWTPEELRAVESGVRRVLIFGVLDGAIYAGDATNSPVEGAAPGSKQPKQNGA